MKSQKPTVNEYIAQCPPKTRAELRRVRKAILAVAPGVFERIAWRVPYYSLKRFMVALNAYGKEKNKLSLIITPGTARLFKSDLAGFDVSGGTIHFTAEHPLPTRLLTRILRARTEVAGRL